MKKILLKIAKIIVAVYVLICVLLYFFQEKVIFFPEKLDSNYQFDFIQKFEEIKIETPDKGRIDGLLFKTGKPKGLIFYLHGNAGSLKTWGKVAEAYNYFNYDVFMPDYRGYGKSEGNIGSEKQLYADIQAAYDKLKSRYNEKDIIILGYSIGTGPAAKLASGNKPKMLILQAPYYSLTDMMQQHYPVIPTFILKYKFETNLYLKKCTMPVVIFHGDRDQVIGYSSALKLKKLFKSADTLITLKGQGHNGMTDNPDYIDAIGKLLEGEQKNPLIK
jgi:uncharacterized protein